MPLEFMQAIVLLEYLYHFKAKRAPDALSEMFVKVYDRLWDLHANQHPKSSLDGLNSTTASMPEDATTQQWLKWIDVHSKERLLSACYIIDSRHALLLARRNHAVAMSGLDLYVPVPNNLWDTLHPVQWAQKTRASNQQTKFVYELLDNIQCGTAGPCEPFPSSVLVACYAASLTCQKNAISLDFVQPSHTMFGAFSHLLPAALSNHPSVRIMTLAGELIALTPFRALVATSGESWFFSKRLAGDARSAADEFNRLKQEMQSWTSNSPQLPMFAGMNGLPSYPPGSFTRAVSISLEIMKEATTAPHPHLILVFGPELAVYFASLVLWAATFAALSQNGISQPTAPVNGDNEQPEWDPARLEKIIKDFISSAPNHISPPILRSQSSPANPPIPHGAIPSQTHSNHGSIGDMSTHLIPMIVPHTATLVPHSALPMGLSLSHSAPNTGVPPLNTFNSSIIPREMIPTWHSGVGAVLQWSAGMLGGPTQRNSGSGELLEGAICVLEKLGRSGWTGSWF
jgi:hypothetical protein